MADTQALVAAESNAEQAAAWDGPHGLYWARHADQFEQSSAAYLPELIRVAGLRPGMRVLDIGCGTGRLSRLAAQTVRDDSAQGTVLGVDLSMAMLDVARDRAERAGLTNLTFVHADAQIYPFVPASFDVVLGMTSAMFFGDKPAALANLNQALRPGGRIVLITWQALDQNPWFASFTSALALGRELPAPPADGAHPFSLAHPGQIKAALGGAGFDAVEIVGLHEPMHFGPDARTACDFMLGQFDWLLTELSDADRTRARNALLDTMQQHDGADGVVYPSAIWLATARRA